MKSVFVRYFVATATMVTFFFLIIAFSFVGIGRNFLIEQYRGAMLSSAKELARTASAISQNEELSSWSLGMSLTTVSNATGNHIFVTQTAL